jgi:glycosyltransferase involved in cell wall biosynthesis
VSQVLYTAAHGGFAGQAVPLGGGAAICNLLVDEWRRTRSFSFRLLDPSILGTSAPTARDLVSFDERRYARFCADFEGALTTEILRHDPRSTVVLSNDISEGPDFARLAAAGFQVSVIYHVDVVAYISAIYLRGLVSPERLVQWQARLPSACSPRILDLIFRKQSATVEHATRVIVPSPEMRDVIGRCYGESVRAKVEVVPWGAPPPGSPPAGGDALRREFGVPDRAPVLLTLSRISPEKGQDLLLRALAKWTGPELWLFVCGEAAYMRGGRYERKLRRLADRLDRVRVAFPGYVWGARKAAFFDMADLYVFPSRHESYGLTLVEALQAGLGCVCLDHSGARAVMRPEFGEVVSESDGALLGAIERMLADDGRRARAGEAGRAWAGSHPFSNAAAEIARLLGQRGDKLD